MPDWLFHSWSRDQNNGLILLKIPPQINLTPPNPQYNPNTTAVQRGPGQRRISSDEPIDVSITQAESSKSPFRPPSNLPSLPLEVHCLIVDELPPVDRVCLALTCKSLCSSVLAAPRLTPATWQKFTEQEACGRASRYSYFYRSASLCTPLPESYTLLQRLAHGWIPKDKLRYCGRCHKIMSRDPDVWRTKIKGKKNPTWDVRTGCDRDEWNNMRRKRRFQHLIKTWCEASFEDSSLMCCDGCRNAIYGHDRDAKPREVQRFSTKATTASRSLIDLQADYTNLISSDLPATPAPAYLADTQSLDRRNTPVGLSSGEERPLRSCLVRKSRAIQAVISSQPPYPIECPTCLERQLTFTFRLPRKSVFRKFLRDCWCSVFKAFWNTLLIIIYISAGSIKLVYEILKMLYMCVWNGLKRLGTWIARLH